MSMSTISNLRSEEVIVISSDDEDCYDTDIILESDDEVTSSEDAKKSFKLHACSYRPPASYPTSTILIEDSDEEEFQDVIHENAVKAEDSDEDLPDICINPVKTLPDLCVEVNLLKRNLETSSSESRVEVNLQKRNPKNNSSISESHPKVLKLVNENLESKTTFGLQLSTIKKRISNSILRGGLKGQSSNPCNRSFISCYETHRNEPKSVATPMQSKALFETMMEDENLHLFALRAMAHRTVSHKQYLQPSLLNLLLQYLFGSEQKFELPGPEGLHLGVCILYKLLHFHPPCKEGMHHIYLKMCQDWFGLILKKVKALLKEEPGAAGGAQEEIEPVTNESTDTDSFYDYTSVIKRKASEKKKKYLSLKRDDKLKHFCVLLKYFSEVMKRSFLQWSIRHWHIKSSALFRKDVCPIISELFWGSSTWTGDWGSVNASVLEIFSLYCESSKIPSLHASVGNVIAICAAILHRKEMAVYPEMGQMTRTYAHKLYSEIKSSSNLEVNLRNVHPDWLKFQVASFFLGVEEPANFYMMKERISKVLRDKDKDLDTSTFNLECVCFEAIKAMMGMVQLKSSEPEHCDLTERVLEENNSWFNKILLDEKISTLTNMIKNILSLPCVKNRKWFFDGFQNFQS